jgi:hypothetical protein
MDALSVFDLKVLKGIDRFQPVSARYLSIVINAPVRPLSLKKVRKYDAKYQLTNELVVGLKHEDENEVEKSINKLVNKHKVIQSVPGYPKRYSVVESTKKYKTEDTNFDDDRLIMDENEYDDYKDEFDSKPLTELKEEIKQNKINYPKMVVV